jgi:hypothetical protein
MKDKTWTWSSGELTKTLARSSTKFQTLPPSNRKDMLVFIEPKRV